MEITAEIDIDQIVDEVVNSTEIERAINDAVDAKVDDAIGDALGSLSVYDIDDFNTHAEEIATDVLDNRLDDITRSTGTASNADLTDRVVALEQKITTLTEALTSAGKLIEALVNFNANV
jgi:glutamine synthetase type III